MTKDAVFARFASPNEQRTISREDAGFYNAVVTGAIYELGDNIDGSSPASFYPSLRRCIEEHPYLCVIVADTDTDKSFYQRVPEIDLARHISVANHSSEIDDLSRIERLVASNVDRPFPVGIPPWRVIVQPLQSNYFVGLFFSHTLGDGLTGAAFHHTFLATLRDPPKTLNTVEVVQTPVTPLPAPFDTPERLPITWQYLITPFLAQFLPRFMTTALNLRTSASPVDANTWTGSTISFDPDKSHTKLKLQEIEASLLANVISAARNHNSRLTGILQQVIVRALSKAIKDPVVTNFVSQTAINMRGSVGIPMNEMGDIVSGLYILHPRSQESHSFTDDDWASASVATCRLAESSSKLTDQPIGLLRYVTSIREWTLGKLGQRRDCSFEVSNIGAFDNNGTGGSVGAETEPRISKVVFAQPGHVIGPPMTFNFASVKGGNLVYSVTWRGGALGLHEADEEDFVEGICKSMKQDLEGFARIS